MAQFTVTGNTVLNFSNIRKPDAVLYFLVEANNYSVKMAKIV